MMRARRCPRVARGRAFISPGPGGGGARRLGRRGGRGMGGAGLDAASFSVTRRWRRGGCPHAVAASMAYEFASPAMASRRWRRAAHAYPTSGASRRWRTHTHYPPPRRRRAPHATPDAGDRQPQVRQGAGLRPLVAAEGRQPRLQGQVVPAPDRQSGLQGPLGAAQDPQ